MQISSSQRLNLLQVLSKGNLISSTSSVAQRANLSKTLMATRALSSSKFDQCTPLFSLSQARQYQSNRWANTSSGSYAPSKMVTSSKSQTSEAHHLGSACANVFEDNTRLPALPVPSLEETMEKLKDAISPMAMNSSEYQSTLQLIDEFTGTVGPKLASLLLAKAEQSPNWLTSDWWQREIYLKSRKPLVINSNPGMIYPRFPFEIVNQQSLINTISLVISGIIDFELALVHGYNPEATSSGDEFHLDPNLCYNQYKSIFGSVRIPVESCDVYHFGDISSQIIGTDQPKPLGLILSYKNHFYEIKLANFENEAERIDKLNGILSKIIAHESQVSSSEDTIALSGPGILTTCDRDFWAHSYRLLDKDSLEAIRDSHFMVSIDSIKSQSEAMGDQLGPKLMDCVPGSEEYKAALSRQILHSDPANVGNRWFDKPIQLIIVTDEDTTRLIGSGINYEHSLAEGQVVSKMIEYSYDKTVQKQRELSCSDLFARQSLHLDQSGQTEFRQLRMFDCQSNEQQSTMEARLKQARTNYCSQINQFDLVCMNYGGYGSNAIKSWCYSPDSWFQVALQLAYYNLHNRLGPCYESASTRRFAFGRTETIRSLNKEVAQFCFQPNPETLKTAVRSHKTLANEANNGMGIDRLLLGFRWTLDELRSNKWRWGQHDKLTKLEQPQTTTIDQLGQLFDEDEQILISSFFNNLLINRSSRYALSTSQVASLHPNIVMSYGPMLADGYSCCYNITGQRIIASIGANSVNQSFSCEVDRLHENLEESLDKMRDIVEN